MTLNRVRTVTVVLAAILAAALLSADPAFAATPTITSFTPTSGPLHTTITITGTNFLAPVTVTVGGIAAGSVTLVSSTEVTASVAAASPTGKVAVSTSGATVTSASSFTVTPGVTPSSAVAPPGVSRTLYFSGFAAYEAVDLYFDSTDIALGSAGGTGVGNLAITVPATATPGTHWFTAVGRHSGYSAQTPITVRTDWPGFQYSANHAGTNPYESVLATSNVSSLGEAWRTPSYGATLGSPAIVGGIVYLGFGDGTVRAFDETTGALKWTYTGTQAFQSSPSVVGGVVYVGSDDGYLYALSATTGARKWRALTGSVIRSSPTVSGGLVYVGSFDDNVYAFNASTGAKVWSFAATASIFASPTVVGGVLYIGSNDDYLYAINATTGALIWKYQTGASIVAAPVVKDGRVYVGSDDKSMYSFRASSGVLIWTSVTGGAIEASAALSSGILYFSSDDGTAYAVTASTGAARWAAAQNGFALTQAVSVENGMVFVGDARHTSVLSASYGGTLTVLDASLSYGGVSIVDGTVTVSDYTDGALTHYTLTSDQTAAVARPDAATLHRRAMG